MADEEKSGADGEQSSGRLTKIVATIFGALIAPLIVSIIAKWVDPSIWRPTTQAATNAPLNRRVKAQPQPVTAPPTTPATTGAPTKPAPPTTQPAPKPKPLPPTPPPPVVQAPPEGIYILVNVSSGKALVPGPMPGANRGEPVLGPPRGPGKPSRRWQLVKTKHGYLIKNVEAGLSLVANRQTAKDPRGTTTYWGVKGDGAADQNWTLTKTPLGYLIKNAQSGRALVPAFATMNEDGGKLFLVDLKTPSGMDHQNWKFLPTK